MSSATERPVTMTPWFLRNRIGLSPSASAIRRPSSLVQGETAIVVVIGDPAPEARGVLVDRQHPAVLEAGQRGSIGHVGVQDAADLGPQAMQGAVDAPGGGVGRIGAPHDNGSSTSSRSKSLAQIRAKWRQRGIDQDAPALRSRARLKWLATASCQPKRAVSRKAPRGRSAPAAPRSTWPSIAAALAMHLRATIEEVPARAKGWRWRRDPNILMIMADQLTALALPAYGHKVVRAPHLDRLAAEGVLFERAYCNFPLCAPSRASLMSGKLASRIGVYDNAAEFPAAVPTLAHGLRVQGYRTCLAGKMHFVGPDQLHGFEERLTTDIYPADFGWTPNWDAPEERDRLVVPQHGLGHGSGHRRGHQPARLRRRGRLPGRASVGRARTQHRWPAAVPLRVLHPPARPLRGAAAPTGTAIATRRSTCQP